MRPVRNGYSVFDKGNTVAQAKPASTRTRSIGTKLSYNGQPQPTGMTAGTLTPGLSYSATQNNGNVVGQTFNTMNSDFESLAAVVALANGKTVGGELGFVYTDALQAIELCTVGKLAVPGVEVLLVRGEGYEMTTISADELPEEDWMSYVKANNALAEEFVRENPAGERLSLMQSNNQLIGNAGGIQGAKMGLIFGAVNAFQWTAHLGR